MYCVKTNKKQLVNSLKGHCVRDNRPHHFTTEYLDSESTERFLDISVSARITTTGLSFNSSRLRTGFV